MIKPNRAKTAPVAKTASPALIMLVTTVILRTTSRMKNQYTKRELAISIKTLWTMVTVLKTITQI